MNRRGEVEIAINKRWIERGIYALIIMALVAFVLWKTVIPHAAAEQANSTVLQDDLALKAAEIERLRAQLAATNKTATPAPAPAPVPSGAGALSANTSSNVTNSSNASALAKFTDNKISVDWRVDSTRFTPAEFNAQDIASMQAQYAALEVQYNDSETSSSVRSELRTTLSDLKANITSLSRGFVRYRVNNITIFITNGKSTDQTIDYTACWTLLDCTKLFTKGNFTAPAGKETTQSFTVKPSLILLSGGSQYLSIYVYSNSLSVLNDTKTFSDIKYN